MKEMIIDRLKEDLRLPGLYLIQFCKHYNLDLSSGIHFRESIQKAIKKLKSDLNELSKQKLHTTKFYYNQIIREYESKQIETDAGKKHQKIKADLFLLQNMLDIADVYFDNGSTIKQDMNENNQSVKKKFEHGELKSKIEEMLRSGDFKKLNIPKHTTLKANQKTKLKSLFEKICPDYEINWNSFWTIMRENDYSASRDKN